MDEYDCAAVSVGFQTTHGIMHYTVERRKQFRYWFCIKRVSC
jgi:hypothetical protein